MDISRLLLGILEEGLLYAIVSFGVYITYTILDFPDLTIDGSFPFGAAITAVLIKTGMNPILVLPICFVSGFVVGTITGLIHVKLKVRDLLSGIIVMTALYSINLRIAGKSNLPIFKEPSIFRNNFLLGFPPAFQGIIPKNLQMYYPFVVLLIITIISKIALDGYFKTKNGYLLNATGKNPILVTSLAQNPGTMKILGLAIANAFVVFAGGLYCQHKGFFEISTGTGTMVIALANVIIGMKICASYRSLKATTAVIIGSIIYRACVSVALLLGFPSSDLKLITAVLLLLVIVIDKKDKRRKTV